MTHENSIDRRTVLKTVPATLVGGTVVAGSVSGTRKATRDGVSSATNEVEIVAKHDQKTDEHSFELSTEGVATGWTTVTFDNRTEHTHFAYLAKIPQTAVAGAAADEVDLLDYYIEHVTRPFQWFMDDIDPEKEPDPDDLSDKYSDPEEEIIFPDWFEAVLPSGGSGLTSGHTASITTVDLEPGEYVVECYVKNEDGEFHSYRGMIDLLTVTDEQSGTSEPEATLDLSLSTAGIDVEESVRPGQQTVGIHVEDQQIYDHLLGHDVHLIRFDERTTINDVNDWMNWMNSDGLVSGGDEPGVFLGGVQAILTPNLLEGGETVTAYSHVNLNPGAYAWVSEVPNPTEKGLLKPFTVPFDPN